MNGYWRHCICSVMPALWLVACGGSYHGLPAGAQVGTSPPPGGADAFFRDRVQPRLEFCRTCHIPGGIGDVDAGEDFLLSNDPSEDYAMLFGSWERLGGNNPLSRILTMSSGEETPHSGGAPWPPGSAAYEDVSVQLACFESGACPPP